MFFVCLAIVIAAIALLIFQAMKDAGERTEDDDQFPGDHVFDDRPPGKRKGPRG